MSENENKKTPAAEVPDTSSTVEVQEQVNTVSDTPVEDNNAETPAARPSNENVKSKIAFIAERKKRQELRAEIDELKSMLKANAAKPGISVEGAEQDGSIGELKKHIELLSQEIAGLKTGGDRARFAELEAKADELLTNDSEIASVEDMSMVYALLDERMHRINPMVAMRTAIESWKEKNGLSKGQKAAAKENKAGATLTKPGSDKTTISGGSMAELERQYNGLNMKKPEDRIKADIIYAKIKEKLKKEK